MCVRLPVTHTHTRTHAHTHARTHAHTLAICGCSLQRGPPPFAHHDEDEDEDEEDEEVRARMFFCNVAVFRVLDWLCAGRHGPSPPLLSLLFRKRHTCILHRTPLIPRLQFDDPEEHGGDDVPSFEDIMDGVVGMPDDHGATRGGERNTQRERVCVCACVCVCVCVLCFPFDLTVSWRNDPLIQSRAVAMRMTPSDRKRPHSSI